MSSDPKSIVTEYYNELQNAFKTGKIDFAKLHFDDAVSVIGPNEQFLGKRVVQEMYLQFIQMVARFDITKQYFDQDSACTAMDCVMRSPQVAIATIEIIFVKSGKIHEIRPVYDTLAWQKVIESQ
jgi:hypothetical protein